MFGEFLRDSFESREGDVVYRIEIQAIIRDLIGNLLGGSPCGAPTLWRWYERSHDNI